MAIIRRGMWALCSGRVGIINGFDDASAQFHEVDASGATIAEHTVPLASIAQAAFLDIPEARRPDEATALRLGYL